LDIDSNALRCATPDHLPERILVVALAHNFEVVASAEEHDLGGRRGLDERHRRCHAATVGGASAMEDSIEQALVALVTLRK
jgi:hypothetical protein